MKLTWRTTVRFLSAAVATVVIVMALVLNVMRAATPLVEHYHSNVEGWASQLLGLPVDIKHIRMTWYGYEPALRLNTIRLYSRQRHPFIKIKHITIGIDLWSSMLNRRWLPGRLKLDGLHLVVHRGVDNQFYIGRQQRIPVLLKQHSSSYPAVKDMAEWLLTQAYVRISHVDVMWYGHNDFLLPLHNIQLTVRNRDNQHHIAGSFSLNQAIKTRLNFMADLQSSHIYEDQLQAKLYLKVKQLSLVQLANAPVIRHYFAGLKISTGQGEGQLWTEWKRGHLDRLQTQFELQHIRVVQSTPLIIKRMAAHALWQRYANGWKLTADRAQLNINHRHWNENQILLRFKAAGEHVPASWRFALGHLRLQDVGELAKHFNQIPPRWLAWLSNLKPRGDFYHLKLAMTQSAKSSWGLSSFGADFYGLSWQQFNRWPAVSDLTGGIDWSPSGGKLSIDSPNLRVAVKNKLYHRQFKLQQAALSAQWTKAKQDLRVNLQNLNLNDGNAFVSFKPSEFYLDSHKKWQLDVHAFFHMKRVEQLKTYFPERGLPVKLRHWLQQAFLAGEVKRGELLFKGPLAAFPYTHHDGDFHVHLEPWNLVFKFNPKWPSLRQVSGSVDFNDRSLSAHIGFAKTRSAKLHAIDVHMSDLKSSHLIVKGRYSGTLPNAISYLQHTPLALAKQFKGIESAGLVQGDLHLDIPIIHSEKSIKLLGHLDVDQGVLSLPSWHTALSHIHGRFNYSDHSCDAKKVVARFLNRPAHISIATLRRKNVPEVVQLIVGGQADIGDIEKQYKLPDIMYLKGTTDYRALLRLYPEGVKSSNSMSLISDLRGLTVKLPEPLGKVASLPRQFYAQMNLDLGRPIHVNARYGKQVSVGLLYKTKEGHVQLQRGLVQIGRLNKSLPKARGLTVSVDLPYIHFSAWRDFYNQWQADSSKRSGLLPSLLDIRLHKLIAANMLWTDFHLRAQPQQKGWFAQLSSHQAVGQLTVYKAFKLRGVKAEFRRFDYTPLLGAKRLALMPEDIPPLDLTFNELLYRHHALGHVHIELNPTSNGVKLTDLNIKSQEYSAKIHGRWSHQAHGLFVESSGSVHFQELGRLLQRWKLTDALSGGRGMVGFELHWPGRLSDFKWGRSTGKINMAVVDGRILNLSKQTQNDLGLGRFLNILSLQSLPRRLMLNFGDLSEKGFSFDEAKGSFVLHKGVATTNHVELNGSQADVTMQGNIGVTKHTYDMHLKIKPNITGSLPFIATVTGGPFAGAITWLVDKLFVAPTIGRAAMVSYRITGPWHKPIVKKVG